jgi:putative transposase
MDRYNVSERTACSLVGLSRAAYRYMPLPRDGEEPLRAEVIRMASTYGRYGYRFIASMMRSTGWGQATTAKVARIWRQEGLKIPQKQPPRGRLWLSDGSCMRLRATYPNHVWSYDFVFIRDAYGGKIRMLTLIDEFSRKCLTIHCARRIGSVQVIEQLANAMILHGIPKYIRSDNGPEFIAKELRSWLHEIGRQVPRDISVVSFNNNDFSAFTIPSISSVDLKQHDVGVYAANAIYQLLNGENMKSINIQPELRIRESSGPAKARK